MIEGGFLVFIFNLLFSFLIYNFFISNKSSNFSFYSLFYLLLGFIPLEGIL